MIILKCWQINFGVTFAGVMSAKNSERSGRATGAFNPSRMKKSSNVTSTFKFPICLDSIKDASNVITGEDAIVCKGRCNPRLRP